MNLTTANRGNTLSHGKPPERPLSVAYVLKMFPRFSETFILNEILELERRGVEIHVFSMKTPSEPYVQPRVGLVKGPVCVVPTFAEARRHHIRAHALCILRSPRRYLQTLLFARARRTQAAWNKFLVAPFIVQRARDAGVEHFHAHFASGPARQAKFASMISGIPFSFTAHAKDLFWKGHQHGKNNKLKKRVCLANFVVTISEFNREFIESQNFKVPRRCLVTVYNGLNLDHWPLLRPVGRPITAGARDRPLFLAVGRLVPKKGFNVLLRACGILRSYGQDFQCVIAGEGPERGRLEHLVEKLGLADHVRLVGPVLQDRLLDEFYSRATLLVQPSVTSADGDQDGIPTVILEALAVGLPVVASPVSGIAEAVIQGETGLLAKPGDPIALAEAMNELTMDPELVHCFAIAGRRLIERRFNLKNNAKILIHLMTLSARGGTRWSEQKTRERAGIELTGELAAEDVFDDVAFEG